MKTPSLNGILQWQNTSIVSSFLSLIAHFDDTGNTANSSQWKQTAKCPLMTLWSQLFEPGFSPLRRLVATATAKRPQSDSPLCLCIDGHSMTIFDELVLSSTAKNEQSLHGDLVLLRGGEVPSNSDWMSSDDDENSSDGDEKSVFCSVFCMS